MICINLGYECRYIYIYMYISCVACCSLSHRPTVGGAVRATGDGRAPLRGGAAPWTLWTWSARRGVGQCGKRQHGILKVLKMTHRRRRLYDTMIWHDSMRFNVSLCLPRRSLWLSALVPTVAKARHPKLRNRMWHTTSLKTCLECDVVTSLGSHSKCLVLLFALLTFATCSFYCFKLWTRPRPCQFWRRKFSRKLRERPWPVGFASFATC